VVPAAAGGEVGCAAVKLVVVASAAHPDAASVAASSAAANMQQLRLAIAGERPVFMDLRSRAQTSP
jgi:hypothetical protein